MRPPHLVVVRLVLRVPTGECSPALVLRSLQRLVPERYEVVASSVLLEPDDGRAASRAGTAQGDSGAIDLGLPR